jgi:SAM-dependent methyltransferase
LPSFDALFSRLVLQHNPPPVAHAILDRLLRALAPGGLAMFQVPTYGEGYRYRVAEDLARADRARGMEMHVLPLDAILQLAHQRRCNVLEVLETGDTGWSHWRSNTFVLRKSLT